MTGDVVKGSVGGTYSKENVNSNEDSFRWWEGDLETMNQNI
jgi:hypothetical protein